MPCCDGGHLSTSLYWLSLFLHLLLLSRCIFPDCLLSLIALRPRSFSHFLCLSPILSLPQGDVSCCVLTSVPTETRTTPSSLASTLQILNMASRAHELALYMHSLSLSKCQKTLNKPYWYHRAQFWCIFQRPGSQTAAQRINGSAENVSFIIGLI